MQTKIIDIDTTPTEFPSSEIVPKLQRNHPIPGVQPRFWSLTSELAELWINTTLIGLAKFANDIQVAARLCTARAMLTDQDTVAGTWDPIWQSVGIGHSTAYDMSKLAPLFQNHGERHAANWASGLFEQASKAGITFDLTWRDYGREFGVLAGGKPKKTKKAKAKTRSSASAAAQDDREPEMENALASMTTQCHDLRAKLRETEAKLSEANAEVARLRAKLDETSAWAETLSQSVQPPTPVVLQPVPETTLVPAQKGRKQAPTWVRRKHAPRGPDGIKITYPSGEGSVMVTRHEGETVFDLTDMALLRGLSQCPSGVFQNVAMRGKRRLHLRGKVYIPVESLLAWVKSSKSDHGPVEHWLMGGLIEAASMQLDVNMKTVAT